MRRHMRLSAPTLRSIAALLLSLALASWAGCGSSRPRVEVEPQVDPNELDASALLARLERQLRAASSITIETRVQSAGVHPSQLGGPITFSGSTTTWQIDGTFGGSTVALTLVGSGEATSGGDSRSGRTFRAPISPAALRDRAVTGLVRMGVLHNLARLVEGEAPDERVSAESGWASIVDAQRGEVVTGEGTATIPIRFGISIDGTRTGEATLWLDARTYLPVRREQTVQFPEGGMTVTEVYSRFEVQ